MPTNPEEGSGFEGAPWRRQQKVRARMPSDQGEERSGISAVREPNG